MLQLKWTLPHPPVKATAWYRWDRTPDSALVQDEDAAIERAFGWPPLTLATLRLAFQKKLPRATGWELTKKLDSTVALEAAARVYKRGVAVRHETPTGAPTLAARSGSYPIHIDPAASHDVPAALFAAENFHVVDANVVKAWPALLPLLPHHLVVAVDEHAKTLATAAKIAEAWRASPAAAKGQGRIVSIGGGCLADIVAFVASQVDARLDLVPTTLLAMADACVGGKTGVNFGNFGKNQIGSFHFPEAVSAWTGWLTTLPPRELRAGGSECLKHAFLSGNNILAAELTKSIAAQDLAALGGLLPAVIGFKADVVAEDPAENGRRATLNFGHTLAHAFETISQARTQGETTLLHGEAVAYGMLYAFILSRRVANLNRTESDAMIEHLHKCGAIVGGATLTRHLGITDLKDKRLFPELLELIAHDKKNRGHQAATDWVLLKGAGKVLRQESGEWTTPVFETELVTAWNELVKTLTTEPLDR